MQAGDFSVSSLDLLHQTGILRAKLSLGLEKLIHLLFELLGSLLGAM
tara:strand:+ start:504 stop:644 length:141 start_codon:yes stop_codon:yes gene_type:complete